VIVTPVQAGAWDGPAGNPPGAGVVGFGVLAGGSVGVGDSVVGCAVGVVGGRVGTGGTLGTLMVGVVRGRGLCGRSPGSTPEPATLSSGPKAEAMFDRVPATIPVMATAPAAATEMMVTDFFT
jgi:hypothetical protein